MPPITNIPIDLLRIQHELTTQQISSLFEQDAVSLDHTEKATMIGKVAEFLKICDILAKMGINFIPLKGPLLSFRLYRDATIRNFADLDLLFDASSIPRVVWIMENEGYKTYDLPWPQEVKKARRLLQTRHHITFVSPDSSTGLEIHWRLVDKIWIECGISDRLIKQNSVQSQFEGRKFTVLNNEMELLYLVIHGGLHQWGKLKWLVDIHMYLKSQKIKWDNFRILANSFQASRLLGLCNILLEEYFPGGPIFEGYINVPEYLVRYSKKVINREVITGSGSISAIASSLWYSMLAYKGFAHKVKVVDNLLSNSVLTGRLGKLCNLNYSRY